MADEQTNPRSSPYLGGGVAKRQPDAHAGYSVYTYDRLGLYGGGATVPLNCAGFQAVEGFVYNQLGKHFTLYVNDLTSLTNASFYALKGGGSGAKASASTYLKFQVVAQGARTMPSAGSSITHTNVILCKKVSLAEAAASYSSTLAETSSYNYATSYIHSGGWASSYIGGAVVDSAGAALSNPVTVGSHIDPSNAEAYGTTSGVSANALYGDNAVGRGWEDYKATSTVFMFGTGFDLDVYPVATHGVTFQRLDSQRPDSLTTSTGRPGVSSYYLDGNSTGMGWDAKGHLYLENPPKYLKIGAYLASPAVNKGINSPVASWSVHLWCKHR